MIWPRLVLLRELLAEDGVIFISIDDNEQHRLRMMMDEIFGEECAISNIIWQKRYAPTNDAKYFSSDHDFVVCYAKKKNRNAVTDGWCRNLLPRTDKQNKPYKNDDGDGRGTWRSGDLSVKSYSPQYDYPIINPQTMQKHLPPKGRCWSTGKDKMQEWINDGRVYFGKTGKKIPRLKRYLSEVQKGLVPLTIWSYKDVGHTDAARKLLKQIFIDKDFPFENPKPIELLKRIIQVSTGKDDIILDSFAGSGTTGHATLAINKEDGGNRKFILVECEDYANSVTAERVKRTIKGVPAAKDDALQDGLGGEFTYCELGEAVDMDKLLTGKSLPSFEALGTLLFHTATNNETIDPAKVDETTGYLGTSSEYHVWLIYKPDLGFLTSEESALTLDKAKEFAKTKNDEKRHLVFAPTRFASDKTLANENKGKGLPVDYQPLPWSLYRVVGS